MTAPRLAGSSARVVLAIIPARGGSVRVPRKNLRSVGGVSLVARSVGQAWVLPDCVPVVSTDDREIAHQATTVSRAMVHWRTAEQANGQQHPALVGALVLDWWHARFGDPDQVVLLQPTSPCRDVLVVVQAMQLQRETDADSVCTVSARGSTLEHPSHPQWLPDGGAWVVPPRTLRAGAWYGKRNLCVQSTHGTGIDINTWDDLRAAERWFDERPD